VTEFVRAESLDHALALLADGFRPIAGGTDLVVAARQGGSSLPERLVSIDRLDVLSRIESSAEELLIGAAVTHARLIGNSQVVEEFTALADAAALVGSPATRNVGTLGGNVMNASPANDTGAPLMVLDARIVLRSAKGERRLAAAEFWTGPGRTVAEPDELCTAIAVPAQPSRSGSAYVRLEYRRAMEIAVVGAAVRIDFDPDGSGRICHAAVALTAVAPTILAVDDAADMLSGRPLDEAALDDIAEAASRCSAPISDLRATEAYRRHCVGVMARRAAQAAARRARGDTIDVPVNRNIGIGALR